MENILAVVGLILFGWLVVMAILTGISFLL